MAEVGVGQGSRQSVVVDDGPVRERVGQLDAKRLH
jgi:hypothetical protein